MAVTIDIKDSVSAALLASRTQLAPEKLALIGARGAANRIRAHLANLEATRGNKDGWPRTHFWAQVRQSVQNPTPTAGGAVISINHLGFALRYFGGVVLPVRRKFLTIPATPEAYGHRAREFAQLKFALAPLNDGSGRRAPALVEAEHTRLDFGRKRKDGSRRVTAESRGGKVFYWLVRKTTHRPDPTVLPSEAEIATAALGAIEAQLQIEKARA